MSALPAFAGYLDVAGSVADTPRRAALLLHSVPAEDRDWLLSQLEPVQRQVVQQLLDELAELGIPAEPQLLDEVVGRIGPVAVDPQASEIARLQQADLAALADWLGREPAGLVARVLRLHDWHWAPGLLQQMGELRRREVQAMLAAAPRAPLRTRGDAQLLALLAQRVAQSRRAAGPQAAPAWRRWLPWSPKP
jgi:hypothetical protein